MRLGIIPAYAGSTWPAGRSPPGPSDHPRIRGEHNEPIEYVAIRTGSSPHTRGAQERGQPVSACAGIIPAYAGSTTGLVAISSGSADHPRIRGEHFLPASKAARVSGSSPHTRGALFEKILGEVGQGSSPHTRGAHRFRLRRRRPGGIIPAYAGSTVAVLEIVAGERDHPRIRGEHRQHQRTPTARLGSSPHTRGAPRATEAGSVKEGIIPAYAGSTWAPCRRAAVGRDHPRIRGEH